LLAAPVRAQTAPDTQLLEVGGQKGMWFPMAKAKQLLSDVSELPKIKDQLALIEKRLELEKSRSELLDRNVKTVEQIAVNWKTTAEGQAKLLANKDPWWRHPYLWTAVGLVVGVGTTVGITYAVKHGTN
jgi:hypothetical protein